MGSDNLKQLWQRWRLLVYLILAIAVDLVFVRNVFYTPLVFSVVLIYFLLSDYLVGSKRKIVAALIWTLVVVIGSLTFYVNNYMPHGPIDEYFEDTRNLNIPEWAKFFRHNGVALSFVLLFAGMAASSRGRKNAEYD